MTIPNNTVVVPGARPRLADRVAPEPAAPLELPLPPSGRMAVGSGRVYRLLQVVGQGGFGTVYRAQMEGGAGFVRQVAVKVLNPGTDEQGELGRRLRDEARMLGLLRHRAVVQVDDLVVIDGRPAVVMEYVEGADLGRLMEGGPLPTRIVCEVGQEVAAALQAAHESMDPVRGQPLRIVHRDIKPANIRITDCGEVKVLDFGVARAEFDQREALTRSLAFGSVGYLAPERHDGVELPAADIYSLGVVLYRALSGSSFGQLSVHPGRHDAGVEAALQTLPEQPRGLVDLLRRMLAYEHELRPTGSEVRKELRALVTGGQGPWLADWAADAVHAANRRPDRRAREDSLAVDFPSPDPASWSGPSGPTVDPTPPQPLRADEPRDSEPPRGARLRASAPRAAAAPRAAGERGVEGFWSPVALVMVGFVLLMVAWHEVRGVWPWRDRGVIEDIRAGTFLPADLSARAADALGLHRGGAR